MRWWMLMLMVVATPALARKPRKPEATPPEPPSRPQPAGLPAPADVAAAPDDATRTASGLAWKRLSDPVEGPTPGPTSKVTVHYTGWTTDGAMFDSSVARGAPATFPLNAVIDGWTEGLQLLRVGESARFWIPQELAYKGSPGAPAGMLVFDVELLDFVTPPPTPLDVSGPPPVATRTESGLAWRALTPGQGGAKPGLQDRVSIRYAAWTTDGRLFDATAGDRTLEVPVTGMLPGIAEALVDMVPGEKRRLWIPEALAFGGSPMRPRGTVVFDLELVEILAE